MAVEIAQEVAASCDAYVCGGISPTVSFKEGVDPSVVKEEFRTEIDIFVQKKVDFLLGEFFGDVRVGSLITIILLLLFFLFRCLFLFLLLLFHPILLLNRNPKG